MLSNKLVEISFDQDSDLKVVLCAKVSRQEEKEKGSLVGITLLGVRGSRGGEANPFRLKPEIVSQVFHPSLSVRKKGGWKLNLCPLTSPITILSRKSGFVCLYPFSERGVSGQITGVNVRGQYKPLKMWFKVKGVYRASATAPAEVLEQEHECPSEFTRRLYEMVTGSSSASSK